MSEPTPESPNTLTMVLTFEASATVTKAAVQPDAEPEKE